MDLTKEISELIGRPEDERLEYKGVLPPSRVLGRLISSFANSEGGYIVLGVVETGGKIVIRGLSKDFRANAITHKAIDLLSPKPKVGYQYIIHEGKSLYIIKIEKSDLEISIDGEIYIRQGEHTLPRNPKTKQFKNQDEPKIKLLATQIDGLQQCTGAMSKFLAHYKSVLNLLDDLGLLLYPSSSATPTDNEEGKILMRILFSSCADNFEGYLTDLLYEIFLANPETLKSEKMVTVKEVLDCADIQEFVNFYAKKKLAKLSRGSVKGFLKENKQIKDLNALDDKQLEEIEKILQIRHLYAHRNGMVDEKFLKYFPNHLQLNDEHRLSVVEMLGKFEYLLETVVRIDKEAVLKYSLVTLN